MKGVYFEKDTETSVKMPAQTRSRLLGSVVIETLNGPLIVDIDSLKDPKLIWITDTRGCLAVNTAMLWGRMYIDLSYHENNLIERHPVAERQFVELEFC
mgnify:CR=1 FL=1